MDQEPQAIVEPAFDDEGQWEAELRPRTLDAFIGQVQVVDNLAVYVKAALDRGDVLDHTLLSGPPGLGKTTLAHILANELGSHCHVTNGPAVRVPVDLAGLLTNLERGDVLFIDEIHRLPPSVEEYLYSAMEDFVIDIMIDKGVSARTMRLDLQPFTLVGATTVEGKMSGPMRARFSIHEKLELYEEGWLEQIAVRTARLLDVGLDDAASLLVACRSRGTPREVNRLMRRLRDVAQQKGDGRIDSEIAELGFEMLGIDEWGLNATDRRLLQALVTHGGGPVGLKTIALMVGESEQTIELVHEAYLICQGYLTKTPQGRVLGPRASELGFEPPPGSGQGNLFE